MVDVVVTEMAELQWIVEVRCTNALLAEMKIGEKGEHVIVNIPNRTFDPSELDKLIHGLVVSSQIAEENRQSSKTSETEPASTAIEGRLSETVEILEERDLYELKLLKTGEIISVNAPDRLFAPSELQRFVIELKAIKSKMAELRRTRT